MSLIGVRQFEAPVSAVFLSPASGPAAHVAHHRSAAFRMLVAAQTEIGHAYRAIRRYPTDRKFGRIDRNPEATRHMERARSYLRTARSHLIEAAQIEAAAQVREAA